MGCSRCVKLLVCELVMAGRSAERLVGLTELGAIQGDGKQGAGYSDAEPHERNLYRAQRKEGRKEGGREEAAGGCVWVFETSGKAKSFVMAGYLGPLDPFHSLRENKMALRAHPLVVLMFLLRPRRNVYHMEKQTPQRFTTGILSLSVKEEEVLCNVCRLSSEARERGSARESGGATPRESGGGCWEQLRS